MKYTVKIELTVHPNGVVEAHCPEIGYTERAFDGDVYGTLKFLFGGLPTAVSNHVDSQAEKDRLRDSTYVKDQMARNLLKAQETLNELFYFISKDKELNGLHSAVEQAEDIKKYRAMKARLTNFREFIKKSRQLYENETKNRS